MLPGIMFAVTRVVCISGWTGATLEEETNNQIGQLEQIAAQTNLALTIRDIKVDGEGHVYIVYDMDDNSSVTVDPTIAAAQAAAASSAAAAASSANIAQSLAQAIEAAAAASSSSAGSSSGASNSGTSGSSSGTAAAAPQAQPAAQPEPAS